MTHISRQNKRSERAALQELIADYEDQVAYADLSKTSSFLLVLRSGPRCHEAFAERATAHDGVIGLDAQYKNNRNRIPIFVVTAQNAHYETLPGYCIVCSNSQAKTIER